MSFDRSQYIKQPSPIEAELKTLFKHDAPLVIFEIGSCEGEDSIKYSRLFPNGSIFSFEPLPDNIELIEKNILKYEVNNILVFNKAVSSSNGTADFFVSSGRPDNAIDSDWDYGNKSSSLLAPANHKQLVNFIKFERKIEIETITLKSFCLANNINHIDFVHMDVQGAELMVLEGAEDFIESVKIIWLEVSKLDIYKDQPLADDIAAFMKKNNFILFKDELYNIQGDQLYISNNYYSKSRIILLKKLVAAKYLFNRLLGKFSLNQ